MSSSQVRPIAIILLVTMVMAWMSVRLMTTTNAWAEDELDYAIRSATVDATAVMVNEDYLMDGIRNDFEKVTVNLDRARAQFQNTLYRNLGVAVDQGEINSMNIPMVGFVGYRYIYGVFEDSFVDEVVKDDLGNIMYDGAGNPVVRRVLKNGASTFPVSYIYTDYVSDDTYTIYNFTLGDKVYVTKVVGNRETEETWYLSKMAADPTKGEHFWDANLTNKQFANMTIMSTINDFLNMFSNSEYSLQAMNAGSGLNFNLGTTDYVGDDNSKITSWSSVIDGPGFFAIIDMFDAQQSGKIRTFVFGGAEYLSRY